MTDSRILYETVIKNNYCIGCGACVVVEGSPFKVYLNEYGNFVAHANEEDLDNAEVSLLDVCPFSGKGKNETELGNIYFPNNKNENSYIGKYLNCYAGFTTDENIRKIGSSGGIGKWLASSLLKHNHVDYYVQVTPNSSNNNNKELFQYAVLCQNDNALEGSRSAYYPTTLAHIIEEIKKIPGRYAITGVPCFIKALRLIAIRDKVVSERIKYTVGIVCGGMKSANQAKMIGWQLGIHPQDIGKIDFRVKNYNIEAATTKYYQVWSNKDATTKKKDAMDIFGTDYGMGFFKPNACDYCDDVVAETADISIGDVWLPKYRFDKKGYSLIIVRNPDLLSHLESSVHKKEISLEDLKPDEAIKSQEGGFRHRREALSYRLTKKQDNGHWYPPKRVVLGEFEISKKRKRIYDLREEIAQKSHKAFLKALERNDLSIFRQLMKKPIKRYKIANEGVLFNRLYVKVIRKLKAILG